MGSLDAFLADLDDLQDDDEVEDDEAEDEEVEEDDEGDVDMMGDGRGARAASGLLTSAKMTRLMDRIKEKSDQSASDSAVVTAGQGGSSSNAAAAGASTSSEAPGGAEAAAEEVDDDTYDLIVSCNEMVIEIEYEIEAIAKTIKDEYARRFPELDSLIPNPLDYARVVLRLGNEIDMGEVDLTGIIPSATIMVVTVTASTTIGTVLPDATLQAVTANCEQVLQLSDNKQSMLQFVESRMAQVAPNLSSLVGPAIAAKLIGQAGGLQKLAALPSTVLQILGSKKQRAQGMSTGGVMHGGFIGSCDIVQNTPPALRNKILRLVAGKATLACRVDGFADKQGGAVGQRFRDEIEVRSLKLQEPAPHKQPKALPVPPEASGKRRGGRRLRKQKERYGMSQMRMLTNRVQFGEEEDTTSDGLLGVGMLGKAMQNGKVRISAKEQKLLSEKNKKQRTAGSSGSTNGLASSLAFTPVQGIELVNPSQKSDSSEGTETYFAKSAAFFKASM